MMISEATGATVRIEAWVEDDPSCHTWLTWPGMELESINAYEPFIGKIVRYNIKNA